MPPECSQFSFLTVEFPLLPVTLTLQPGLPMLLPLKLIPDQAASEESQGSADCCPFTSPNQSSSPSPKSAS